MTKRSNGCGTRRWLVRLNRSGNGLGPWAQNTRISSANILTRCRPARAGGPRVACIAGLCPDERGAAACGARAGSAVLDRRSHLGARAHRRARPQVVAGRGLQERGLLDRRSCAGEGRAHYANSDRRRHSHRSVGVPRDGVGGAQPYRASGTGQRLRNPTRVWRCRYSRATPGSATRHQPISMTWRCSPALHKSEGATRCRIPQCRRSGSGHGASSERSSRRTRNRSGAARTEGANHGQGERKAERNLGAGHLKWNKKFILTRTYKSDI